MYSATTTKYSAPDYQIEEGKYLRGIQPTRENKRKKKKHNLQVKKREKKKKHNPRLSIDCLTDRNRHLA